MNNPRLADIADRLTEDWVARRPHANLAGEDTPADIAEAYAIQKLVQHRFSLRRGARVGWKIALSSKAMQLMVGIDHPIAGAFFVNDIQTSPTEIAVEDFRHLGLEFELAIVMSRDLTPDDLADQTRLRSAVATVHPAFELIEDRDADYGNLDARTLVAENAWAAGVILGPEIPAGSGLDLASLNGVIAESGLPDEATVTGAADPVGSLAWVASHAAAQGTPLLAGEIVITGSAARTRFPEPGARLSYTIEGVTVALDVV